MNDGGKTRNVHITLSREDADALLGGEVSLEVQKRAADAIADAERLEAAMESARKLDEEGKLGPPLDLSKVERREDQLRVIYREPDGKERRCSMFLPLPDNENLIAALRAAYPPFTAYTYNEAQRMIEAEQQEDRP